MNRHKIVVSRKYHGTQIEAFLTDELGARMDLDDFLDALVEEVGNPTMVFTKASLKAKLKFSSIAVIDEMKKATVHVVGDK